MEMVMSQQVRRIAELEASEGKLQHGKRKVGEESPGNISAHAAIWKPTSRRHRPQMLSGINGPSSRPSTTTRNLNLCLELKLQRREMSLTCSCSAAPASAEQPKDAGKAQIQVLNIECYLQSCEGSLDIHPVWADVSDLQASDLRHFSPRWVRLRGLQANKVEKKINNLAWPVGNGAWFRFFSTDAGEAVGSRSGKQAWDVSRWESWDGERRVYSGIAYSCTCVLPDEN